MTSALRSALLTVAGTRHASQEFARHHRRQPDRRVAGSFDNIAEWARSPQDVDVDAGVKEGEHRRRRREPSEPWRAARRATAGVPLPQLIAR